ncbi:Frataxin [Pseudovirgaria hyperparasitica]|uniref:ferroxidase n=1 Tax=Pseudovirgaria hyperparasitica TaxID=470096 RepID=A0A6A6VRS0_9PEZI|nr:Frataxin [Pseudovirgaria hyperparasitica]KAF2752855.1 Frataxin [Pseudovirgaria hyperparasitica]
MPDAENPAPKESEPMEHATQPTNLTTDDYHKHADAYLNELVEKLEESQETSSEIDVEYSAGVLTVEIVGRGSYVLNKQPPNKQIWLSSPISGPKRFDWVTLGESMEHKEGSGTGDWVCLRDGSSLTDIIQKELGVQVGAAETVYGEQ